MDELQTYTTTDIIARLQIPKQRLREWIDRGYIIPSVQRAKGVGTKNLFTKFDLYLIALFKHLIEALRLPREQAARFVKELRTGLVIPPPQLLHTTGINFILKAIQNYNMIWFRKAGNDLSQMAILESLTQATPEGKDALFDLYSTFLRKMIDADDDAWPDWDDVVIVNFKKLREETDQAFR